VVLNEVESNPEDWFELVNTGLAPIDLSGWLFRDNDPLRVAAPYVIPAGTMIAPGQFLVIEGFGFGLGSADSVILSDATDRQILTYSWTAHASTTLGRCPDGTGEIVVTLTGTKGAANSCGSPVKINEVESAGGVPGDWVELINPSSVPVDVSGYVVRDTNDTPEYVLPAGTTIAANGFLVIEEASLGFAFDPADAVRLLGPGAGALIDSYAWTADATQTFGRCPDGTGVFEDTVEPTKGGQNHCVGIPFFGPWPGGSAVAAVDDVATFTSNLSGLDYQAGVLWAVVNGPGTLHRLAFNGTTWSPVAADGWAAGKLLRYPDGTGDVDAEGVTLGAGSGSVYVGSERNNANNGVSRNTVLQFDTTSTVADPLTATRSWDLTAALPVTGPNTGIEAVTFVPDPYLVAEGFVDQSTGVAYDPANYPNNGGGLFLVGVEATGGVYAFELDHSDGTATLVATIASGFPGVMALEFDAELGQLWAVCDDTCLGRSSVFQVGASGTFQLVRSYERPAAMPNINNEGFAFAPLSECSGGVRPVFWSDDSDTAGNSLRAGTVTCTAA
jgi:Lamin Tail Domain